MKIKLLSFPRKWESLNCTLRFPLEAFGNDKSRNIIRIILLGLVIILLNSCSSSSEFSEYENVSGEFIESGVASWYGPEFHGKKTASGERFNTYELTAAHRTLPFNSIVRVINSENGKSVIVRINDRGPFSKKRIIDLSERAADNIDLISKGTARVKLFLLNDVALPKNLEIAHYTVQVGSYKRKNDAENFATQISNSEIVKANINGETYYRIFVGNFTTKSDAENLLHELKQKGIDGFVKQVEN